MEVNDLGSEPAKEQPTAATPPAEGVAPGGASEKPTRPEWLPESYFDADAGSIKLDDFGKHYGELATAAKTETERLAAYPKTVEEVKFTLPADLKLPDGVTFDENNPQFTAFRQFVFDKKIDPAVGNEMLGMYARERANEVNAINQRVEEEKGKLGANAAARITALRQFWEGHVGADLAKSVMAGVFTSPQVEAMEKLMLAFSNQQTQNPPGGSREDKPEGITDEEYEAMSPQKRLEYARSKQKPA